MQRERFTEAKFTNRQFQEPISLCKDSYIYNFIRQRIKKMLAYMFHLLLGPNAGKQSKSGVKSSLPCANRNGTFILKLPHSCAGESEGELLPAVCSCPPAWTLGPQDTAIHWSSPACQHPTLACTDWPQQPSGLQSPAPPSLLRASCCALETSS